MATDERKWKLSPLGGLTLVTHSINGREFTGGGPGLGVTTTVVPETRAVAAEQDRDNLRVAWRGAEREFATERNRAIEAEEKLHGFEQRVAELEEDVERLRARTHQIAEAKDAEHKQAMRDYGRLREAVESARERTRSWEVDWTTDPPSQADYGWWRYTSHNHAMEVVALLVARDAAEAERDALAAALRLARSMILSREPMSVEAEHVIEGALGD
jgi:chromosome segregation ATPase